jgi:hypothetical protein
MFVRMGNSLALRAGERKMETTDSKSLRRGKPHHSKTVAWFRPGVKAKWDPPRELKRPGDRLDTLSTEWFTPGGSFLWAAFAKKLLTYWQFDRGPAA